MSVAESMSRVADEEEGRGASHSLITHNNEGEMNDLPRAAVLARGQAAQSSILKMGLGCADCHSLTLTPRIQ